MNAPAPLRPVHPITILRDAVLWARASGVPVRIGSWGIVCTSEHAQTRWERDPRATGVDPLATVILEHQPEATELHAAAAEVLDVPPAYVHGLEDGFAKQEPAQSWAQSSARRLYLAGWEAGSIYREEFLRARPPRTQGGI